MKRAVLFIAIMTAVAWNFAGSPDQSSRASKQKIAEQQPLGMATVINNYQRTEPEERTTRQSPKWYASPEWVLVIVGIITFIVIGWQSLETRRAAEAANQSAVALINSERAWVVARLHKNIPNVNSWELRFKNWGRTPARVVIVRNKSISQELPERPFYEDSVFKGEFETAKLIAPNEEWIYRKEITLSIESAESPPSFAFSQGAVQLWHCGFIEYRDIFREDITHETRFCFHYVAAWGEFESDGPSVYTRYT